MTGGFPLRCYAATDKTGDKNHREADSKQADDAEP